MKTDKHQKWSKDGTCKVVEVHWLCRTHHKELHARERDGVWTR